MGRPHVGKGKGNRVFAHAAQQLEISNDPDIDEDDTSLKLRTIGEIRAAGLEVIHVVHRHGMDEATPFEVEAALMDAYAGLSNIAGGHGNTGCSHVEQLEQQYNAEPAPVISGCQCFRRHRRVRRYYQAARFAWTIADWRRKMGAPVVGYTNGIIRAVHAERMDGYLLITLNFPVRRPNSDVETMKKKWGFVSRHTSGKRGTDTW